MLTELKFSIKDPVKISGLELSGVVCGMHITENNVTYDVRINNRGIMTFSEAEIEHLGNSPAMQVALSDFDCDSSD